MSDYDDGWNEGFDLGACTVKKLQAENAKLEAIVYAAKAVMRSYKHKNAGWSVSGIYAELEQAIKEVSDEYN